MFKNEKGLGFIEMIVALGVIVTGVIAGLSLTTHNLISSNSSEDRLVAANLARESIEVIRNHRDSNWLAGNNWYQGFLSDFDTNYRLITEFDPSTKSWSFSDISSVISLCDSCQVYFDNTSDVFNHDNSGDLTSFKRLVTLQEICWQDPIDTEVLLDPGDRCSDHVGVSWIGYHLESEVTWFEADKPYNLSIVDKLYDWE
ncbi:hypothetical protein HOC73_04580 [bacterium]|nr:hypothetical protein [bacterium]